MQDPFHQELKKAFVSERRMMTYPTFGLVIFGLGLVMVYLGYDQRVKWLGWVKWFAWITLVLGVIWVLIGSVLIL